MFPEHPQDVPDVVVRYIARQVDVEASAWPDYRWRGRTIEYHLAQIRKLLSFREATVDDGRRTPPGSSNTSCLATNTPIIFTARSLNVVGLAHRTAVAGTDRPLGAVGIAHLRDAFLCHHVSNACRLRSANASKHCCCRNRPRQGDPQEQPEPGWAVLTGLLADPGPANLESLLEEVAKLDRVRAPGLPPGLFDGISPKVLQTYRRRLAAESAYELRRHSAPLRLTLLAVFGHLRGRSLTDGLVDL